MEESKPPTPTSELTTAPLTAAVVVKSPPVKGWRTSEFWVTVGLVLLNHVLGMLRQSPGPVGSVASLIADGLAVGAYNVSRGMAKR